MTTKKRLFPIQTNIPINLIIMVLIVAGGLGFTVWTETGEKLAKPGRNWRTRLARLSLHAKLASIFTGFLIVAGALLFLLIEWNNPGTLGKLSWGDKTLVAFFQSVTLRTAGFDSMSQGDLTDVSKFLSSVLMIIGGSPASAAGGIKTVTLGVVFFTMVSVLRGRKNLEAFGRDEAKLQQASELAAHLVQIDATDETALEKLGLGNFEVVVLAIGDDFEASQIAAMIAKESGTKHIIVKARTRRQKSILERIGVHEVILPEQEIGAKLARRMVSLNITDILEESPCYTITEMRPMDEWVNKTLQEANIRQAHNITVLGIRHGGKLHIPVLPTTMIHEGDILIALNENKKTLPPHE